MRDIWDVKRKVKEVGGTKGHKILPSDIEKYLLDYLTRKKAFLETKEEIAEIFADYEKRLGSAGFFKI